MKPSVRFEIVLSVLVAAAMLTAPAHASGSCPADVDGDGIVGEADVELIVAAVGPVDPNDPVRSRADLNGNGYVCDADLLMLYDNWGPCLPCPADLNDDGQVDAADRAELEAAFGRSCRGNLGRFGDVGTYDVAIFEISLTPPGAEPHPDADPRADLNGDGVVDTVDQYLLMSELGTPCRPDLSSDGEVDAGDLWRLLASWGPCPSGAPAGPSGDIEGEPPKQCDPKGG